jgi:hypothetical protein
MGVIPLPKRAEDKAGSVFIGTPRHIPSRLRLTSSDGDTVSKLVGLVLVLLNRSLEGQGLAGLEVSNVLGHLSGLQTATRYRVSAKSRLAVDLDLTR